MLLSDFFQNIPLGAGYQCFAIISPTPFPKKQIHYEFLIFFLITRLICNVYFLMTWPYLCRDDYPPRTHTFLNKLTSENNLTKMKLVYILLLLAPLLSIVVSDWQGMFFPHSIAYVSCKSHFINHYTSFSIM